MADVYVELVPVTGRIAAELKKALLSADDDVKRAAKRWEREIDRELGDAEIDVDADTTKAKKEIERVEKGRYRAEVKVDVDQASLAKVHRAISSAGGGGGDLGLLSKGNIIGGASTLAVLAPNIVPAIGGVVQAAGQLSGVLGLLPAAAGAAGLAIGSLKIATAGFADAIKEVGDPAKFAEAIKALAPKAQQAATACHPRVGGAG